MGERENDVEGQPREARQLQQDQQAGRTSGEPVEGEDVAREARSVEGIPASAQGDGEGDDRARGGALEHHRPNPEIGEVGA